MHSLKRRGTLLAVVMTLLTGCAGGVSDSSVCPKLKDYSRAFNDRLADEVAVMPRDSATVEAVGDYMLLRGQVRSCSSRSGR